MWKGSGESSFHENEKRASAAAYQLAGAVKRDRSERRWDCEGLSASDCFTAEKIVRGPARTNHVCDRIAGVIAGVSTIDVAPTARARRSNS